MKEVFRVLSKRALPVALLLTSVCVNTVYAVDTFTKTEYEEFYRYHDFGAWLDEDEILQNVDVSAYIKDTTSIVTSSMITTSGIDPDDKTRIFYKVKDGAVPKTYTIRIRVVTTNNNKFEDKVYMTVIR